ncbi:hypothetical protein [Niabella sp.]|uniref:hypothetical protein n=1 Tax=Niabella sp. TaxID=1962976 RepID=UPI00260B5BFF|nr:hypothetical protein [Niabella sp.]
MNQKELTALTNDELLQEVKKSKSSSIFDAAMIGFLIGVVIFSAVKKGWGLLSFLPVIYIPIAARNNNRRKALNALLKERGLK